MREEATRVSLKNHFGEYDKEVWNYPQDALHNNGNNEQMQSVDNFGSYDEAVWGYSASTESERANTKRMSVKSEDTPNEGQKSAISGSINISVQRLDGRKYSLLVRSTDTVDSVKGAIQEKTEIRRDLQRLFFAGRQLEDGRTLDYYNIGSECTLDLILRMFGC